MESGNLRNIDQIQENDPSGRGSRVGTLVLASIAGACVVFAVFALVKRPTFTDDAKSDPLAELVDKNASASSVDPSSFAGQSVSFPNLLSDDPNPTTAMAAIRGGATPVGSAGVPFALPPGSPTDPPPAGDSLPVVPLPAQNYLSMSPVVTQPRDSLTAMAQDASTSKGEEVAQGAPGGFQLQVSSFRKEKTAAGFAKRLRKRGHHAYIEAALVPGKGTWFRVRVGPFKSRYEAMNYRKEFERREHIVSFLVEPPRKVTASRTAH